MPASLVRRALPKSLSEPGVIACEIGPGGRLELLLLGGLGLRVEILQELPACPGTSVSSKASLSFALHLLHQPGYSSVSASASHSFVQDPKTASPGISPRGRLLPHPPDGPFA